MRGWGVPSVLGHHSAGEDFPKLGAASNGISRQNLPASWSASSLCEVWCTVQSTRSVLQATRKHHFSVTKYNFHLLFQSFQPHSNYIQAHPFEINLTSDINLCVPFFLKIWRNLSEGHEGINMSNMTKKTSMRGRNEEMYMHQIFLCTDTNTWVLQLLYNYLNELLKIYLYSCLCVRIFGRVCTHCTYRRVCKHTCPKQESRLSSVSALKTASISISLSIYICVWELASVSAWPPECTLSPDLYGESVSVGCHCWQTGHIGRAGGGRSHAILGPDSGQTRHRPVTKGGPVWRGSQAAGVCVNVYGICLYARP